MPLVHSLTACGYLRLASLNARKSLRQEMDESFVHMGTFSPAIDAMHDRPDLVRRPPRYFTMVQFLMETVQESNIRFVTQNEVSTRSNSVKPVLQENA